MFAASKKARFCRFKLMENSVDYVTVHSNCQESSILDHAQDVCDILTSPDRELGTKYLLIILIICILENFEQFCKVLFTPQ